MLLLLSMILAVLPLLGIAGLIYVNPALTVDNLFMSLILLTISGIFGINVLLELRDRGLPMPLLGKKREPGMVAVSAGRAYVVMPTGEVKESGVVESVAYYESAIGQTNRCVVTLRDGAGPRMLVFKGDVRDQFPLGGRVTVTYRSSEEGADLLDRKLA
ncbi:MAG: hypothetical protein ACHP9S_07775 [Terriglobales bacterium]|jgi:hypothetical protein